MHHHCKKCDLQLPRNMKYIGQEQLTSAISIYNHIGFECKKKPISFIAYYG